MYLSGIFAGMGRSYLTRLRRSKTDKNRKELLTVRQDYTYELIKEKNMLYILDTADIEAIKHCNEFYPLAGVTTKSVDNIKGKY